MPWGWLISVGYLAAQFIVAAALIPDMRRRKVQWWWQILIVGLFFPSSIAWVWIVDRRDARSAAAAGPQGGR